MSFQSQFRMTQGIIVLSIAAIFGAAVYEGIKNPQAVADAMPGETKAYKALDDAGIKQIQLGSNDYYSCAQDDTMGIQFNGVNPNGKPVHGVVCMDYMKGSTIRYK